MAPPQRPLEGFEAFKARATTSSSSSRPTPRVPTSSSAGANSWPAVSTSSANSSSSAPHTTSPSTSTNLPNASQINTTTQKKPKKNKFVPLTNWQESESGSSSAAPPVHPGPDSTQVPSWSRYPVPNTSTRGNRRSRGGPKGRNNTGRGLETMMQNVNLGQVQPVRPIQRGPLTEFKLFMKFAPEIRIKIYGMICSQARILEMSWGFADPYDEMDSRDSHHYFSRLARKSRFPPAIMQVNQEAREEAKEFYYQPVDFCTAPRIPGQFQNYPATEPFPIWYNPKADVVLFGENTCMNTLVHFLNDQRERGVTITQIAILLSGNNIKCYESFNELDDATVMQALHGVHRSITGTNLFSGAKGLKNVDLIVPTHLVKIAPGTIDESIWFRPAIHNGMTSGQVAIKTSIEAEVTRVRAGAPLQGCGRLDNWTQNERDAVPAAQDGNSDENDIEDGTEDDQNSTQEDHHNEKPEDNRPPTFRFVSFTPAANAGEVFDSVPLSTQDLPKFNMDRWAPMQKIERDADVHIKVPDRDFPGQMQREIGFWGRPEGVAQAKEMVAKRIDDLKNKTMDWKRSHRREGYRSRGNIRYFGSEHTKNAAAAKY